MASAGQIVEVVICSAAQPDISLPATASFQFAGCPAGQFGFVVQAYLPVVASKNYLDSVAVPFDPVNGGSIFGFGFSTVVFFWALGLKGGAILDLLKRGLRGR